MLTLYTTQEPLEIETYRITCKDRREHNKKTKNVEYNSASKEALKRLGHLTFEFKALNFKISIPNSSEFFFPMYTFNWHLLFLFL